MFMLTDDDFIDLNSRFYTTCKPMSRIFTLLTVPTALFAIIVLCYFGFFPLKVEIHSVVLIGFIYLIYLFFIRHNAYYVSCKFKTQYEELFFYRYREYPILLMCIFPCRNDTQFPMILRSCTRLIVRNNCKLL